MKPRGLNNHDLIKWKKWTKYQRRGWRKLYRLARKLDKIKAKSKKLVLEIMEWDEKFPEFKNHDDFPEMYI